MRFVPDYFFCILSTFVRFLCPEENGSLFRAKSRFIQRIYSSLPAVSPLICRIADLSAFPRSGHLGLLDAILDKCNRVCWQPVKLWPLREQSTQFYPLPRPVPSSTVPRHGHLAGLALLNSGSSTRFYGMRLTAAMYNGAVRGQPVDSHMIICHTSVTCETPLLCLYIYHIRRVNMI